MSLGFAESARHPPRCGERFFGDPQGFAPLPGAERRLGEFGQQHRSLLELHASLVHDREQASRRLGGVLYGRDALRSQYDSAALSKCRHSSKTARLMFRPVSKIRVIDTQGPVTNDRVQPIKCLSDIENDVVGVPGPKPGVVVPYNVYAEAEIQKSPRHLVVVPCYRMTTEYSFASFQRLPGKRCIRQKYTPHR